MRNNLSPESAPWGREVDRRLTSLENTIQTLTQDNTNAFKGISSSLAQLSEQLTTLQATVNQSNNAIARLNQFTTTSIAGPTLVANSTGGGVVWSSAYAELIVTTPPNCVVTVDFGGNAAGGYTPSSPAVGSSVRTFLSFEEVGESSLYLGSALTTAALWVPIEVGVQQVRAPLFKSSIAHVNSGNTETTRTFRLRSGVAGFGTDTASGFVDNPVLSVKVAPLPTQP